MSVLNNAIRSLGAMGNGALTFVASTGTDTYTATLAPVPDALATDFLYCVNITNANTSPTPTLNLNAFGAKTVTDMTGAALVAGSLNGRHFFDFDGTNLRVLNPAVIPTATSATTATNLVSLSAASIWSTGDVKMTLKTVADTGWVMMNDGAIGDASSGGTTRANADTSALFTLLWNNTANAQCPVSTGRGANAAADFAAHKTITLPLALGRALAVSGAGSGLTSRVLGFTVGEETHQLTVAELAQHNHTGSFSGNAITLFDEGSPTTPGNVAVGTGTNSGDGTFTPSGSVTVNNTGSNTAHNNMQPSSFLNIMIKL